MSAKQKIVHGRGPSNINLGISVCSFDVCRASEPIACVAGGILGAVFQSPPPQDIFLQNSRHTHVCGILKSFMKFWCHWKGCQILIIIKRTGYSLYHLGDKK